MCLANLIQTQIIERAGKMAEASAAELTVNITQLVCILAINLSVVALIVTVLGFFASLKFYRHGINLQQGANDALAKIEEKASSIQSQVGGMFDKTLEAAIANKQQISTDFNAINEKLEKAKTEIVDAAQQEIGTVGKTEQAKLKRVVEENLKDLEELVLSARESATTAVPRMQHDVIFPHPVIIPEILQTFLQMELKKTNTKIENFEEKGRSSIIMSLNKPIDAKTKNLLLLIADKFGYNLQVNWSAIEEG